MERLAADVRSNRRAAGRFPAGEMGFSLARTRSFEREPLPMCSPPTSASGPSSR
jgi:hypothetical protein